MAKPKSVIEALELLSDSALDFTPTDLGRTAEVWIRIFADIPEDVFKTAITDYLRTETRFPAPAKVRALCERVLENNRASVSRDRFSEAENYPRVEKSRTVLYQGGEPIRVYRPVLPGAFRGVYRVSPGGWNPVRFGEAVEIAPVLETIEPPDHPEFKTWEEAQEWQEKERAKCTQ